MEYPIERSDILNLQELEALRTAAPPNEDRVDIRNLTIDMDAPVAVRAQHFLEQIKNPYAFKCGDFAVNIGFAPEGKTLRETMASYLTAQKKRCRESERPSSDAHKEPVERRAFNRLYVFLGMKESATRR